MNDLARLPYRTLRALRFCCELEMPRAPQVSGKCVALPSLHNILGPVSAIPRFGCLASSQGSTLRAKSLVFALGVWLAASQAPAASPPAPYQQVARDIFRELIE